MKEKKLNLEDLDQVTGGVTCNAVKDVNIPGTDPVDDEEAEDSDPITRYFKEPKKPKK